MTQFGQHYSSPAETVTKVSQRVEEPTPRRQPLSRRPYAKIVSTKAHPLAWAAALARCAGDPRRIEIIDYWHLEIHNDPDWRRQR